jgi:uncharacterized OsmC-like protein
MYVCVYVYEQKHLGLVTMAMGYKYAHFAKPATTSATKETHYQSLATAASTRIPDEWGYTRAHSALLSAHLNLLAEHECTIYSAVNTTPCTKASIAKSDAEATGVKVKPHPTREKEEGLYAAKLIAPAAKLVVYPGKMLLAGAAVCVPGAYTMYVNDMRGKAVMFQAERDCKARRINDPKGTGKEANVRFDREWHPDLGFMIVIYAKDPKKSIPKVCDAKNDMHVFHVNLTHISHWVV